MRIADQVTYFGRPHGMDETVAAIAVGHIAPWEIVVQAAILLGAIYLTVRIASRIYAVALVRGGARIPWAAALRLRPARS